MSKRQRDIKTKLMAAICMLLVSSIMMVSTTYAWFTLSTAPEVTGIQTAVGANGNLEMALLPASGDINLISSEAGDSGKPLAERNITWGNLVDLSDNATYGLNHISMYPSQLNVGVDGKIATAPLSFPQYGADGRISLLAPNTTTGTYNGTSFTPEEGVFGVRAVGSASGMTDRQISYRNARGAAATATSYAAQLASNSLNSRGNALASIAVKKGTNEDPKFTADDIEVLEGIVDDLVGTNGVFAQINKAYLQYVLAYAASAATGTTEVAWTYVKGLVEAQGATIESVVAAITNPPAEAGVGAIQVPAALQTALDKYTAAKAMVTNADGTGAKEMLEDLEPDTDGKYSWIQIQPILSKLADPDKMEINGVPAGQIKAEGNMNKLMNSVIGGAGVNVVISSGGGVYADIAEQTTNFTADVNIQEISYAGSTFGPVPAKMKTNAEKSYLTNVGTAVEAAGAPAGGAAGSVPITDMYGYIIDMAFRTNAANSNLVLQREAIDRIYTSNEEGVEVANETTMGHGANMTFTSVNSSFSNDKVKDLMRAIRVVFFNPNDGTIIKYALLNVDAATTTAEGGVKADLYLCDMGTGAATVSYFTDTETDTENGGTTYTIYYTDATKATKFCRSYNENVEGTTVTKWQLWTTTTDETSGETTSAWGTATETEPDNIPIQTTEGKATLVPAADQKIMGLTQNTATKLSVLVYLDGNVIGNDDVASSGTNSVVGTMNLQFSSDGNLSPMNYTPLMNQGTTTATEATTAPTETQP